MSTPKIPKIGDKVMVNGHLRTIELVTEYPAAAPALTICYLEYEPSWGERAVAWPSQFPDRSPSGWDVEFIEE